MQYVGHIYKFLGVIERTKNKGSFIKQLAYGKLEEVVSFCFQLSGFGFEELKEARLQMEMAILPLIIRRATPENLPPASRALTVTATILPLS